MGKSSVGLLAWCLCIMFFFFADSCRKAVDLKFELENGDAELGQCVIQEMSQALPAPLQPQDLKFYYNSRMDPVSVEASGTNPAYSKWLFYYDNKNRLSQYIIINPDGSFRFWHIYFHDTEGRITGDSTYSTGIVGQKTTAQYRWFNQLFYDRLNRIIYETQTGAGQFYAFTYHYNSAGNLTTTIINYNNLDSTTEVWPGYVDQVNVLLTNKIWRFLARDYSVNSHFTAASTNERYLPTAYLGANGEYTADFFFGGVAANQGMEIGYDCGRSRAGGY